MTAFLATAGIIVLLGVASAITAVYARLHGVLTNMGLAACTASCVLQVAICLGVAHFFLA